MTIYNESDKEEVQKYSGWYWCSQRQGYYRWNQFIEGLKDDTVR